MSVQRLSLIYLVKEHSGVKPEKSAPERALFSEFVTARLVELRGIERGGLPSRTVGPRFSAMLDQSTNTQTTKIGGATRDRTADLLNANQALSQLSYSPVTW